MAVAEAGRVYYGVLLVACELFDLLLLVVDDFVAPPPPPGISSVVAVAFAGPVETTYYTPFMFLNLAAFFRDFFSNFCKYSFFFSVAADTGG